jgi:1-acylglycerone phosphate reductase
VYNASKAALMSWSETLRLELEPFGVRVVSLVTGSVATNVMSHAELRLPATSVYQKATQEIQKRGVGEDVQSKSSPAAFAKAVVADVLGGATGPLWRGAMASAVRIMSSFLPTSVVVREIGDCLKGNCPGRWELLANRGGVGPNSGHTPA